MDKNKIIVTNARENNLKNVSISIPKNELVILTGVSGSGKSSLAFNTIYAEGQRRYLESLNSYARQFLGIKNKPDVDKIEGLSPAISIDQKSKNHNPRSTIGTVTEIYDYLRVLFASVGKPHCIHGHGEVKAQTLDEINAQVTKTFSNKPILILSPVVQERKGSHRELLAKLKKDGFMRVKIADEILNLDEEINLTKNNMHTIDIVVDRIVLDNSEDTQQRLFEAIEASCKYSNGMVKVECPQDKITEIYSKNYSCKVCGFSFPKIEPRLFSFNSPLGACPSCEGLGYKFGVNQELLLDKELSINDGGILFLKNIVNSTNIMWQTTKIICNFYDIPCDIPIKFIDQKKLDYILKGSDREIEYELKSNNNRYLKKDFIEGIQPLIERRFTETKSDFSSEYYKSFMSEIDCDTCNGARLSPEPLHVFIDGINIHEFTKMSIEDSYKWIQNITLSESDLEICKLVIEEISSRLKFLNEVGLGYISLDRKSDTLSGGEFQRIRLATQISSRLTGILYVLDEPSIGLHQRDNQKLINSLKNIRDLGNTLLVVEHDEETMLEADYLIDVGPKAGIYGGEIVDKGEPLDVIENGIGLTSQYLRGEKTINTKIIPNLKKPKFIEIKGANENNLQNINVQIPLNQLVVVTGVSGSGKSTLINSILYNGLRRKLGFKTPWVGKHSDITGWENISQIEAISQDPIGRTNRSNPATYVGLFDDIRSLFAQTPAATMRGYKPGRFSFNVPGGRCEKCDGNGTLSISMLFMADVNVVCDSCNGQRYNKETLAIKYKDKNIYEVLEMSVDEAAVFFENQPKLMKKIKVMQKVGLGYMKLGQSSTVISGGEAQRLKLSAHLLTKGNGKTLYILDEPTTGLHFEDIKKLSLVFKEMVERGDSIIVIEHNLDVIKLANHIIDLGPEGGNTGGKIVVSGDVDKVIMNKDSHTGKFLNEKLKLDAKRLAKNQEMTKNP